MKKMKILAITSITVMIAVVIGIFGVKAQSVEVSTVEQFLEVISTGGKIKLVDDIPLGEFTGKRVTIAQGTKVEIDLNGYTISGKSTDEKISTALIQNNGTLIIDDNSEEKTGKITLSDTEVAINKWAYGIHTINNEGTLEVNGGTIENTGKTDVPYAIDNNTTSRNATITINGGNIVANKAAIRAFCNSTTNENKIIINDGNVTAGSSAVWISQVSKKANKGYLEINGGTLYGQKYNGAYISVFDQSLMNNISVKITGGTIKNNSETAASFTYEYWSSTADLANANLNLEITGGTFINENENGRAFYNPEFLEIPVTYTNIKGGSYTTDISEYVKEGYVSRLVGDMYQVGVEYDVTVEQPTNGKVVADKTKAITGETVTLTVTPDEEYELVSIKALDAENNIIPVTDGKFTMPTSDVTVTVELKKIEYAVTVTEPTNGMVEVDKEKATAGETVTVTATPDTEYSFASIKVLDKENNEVEVTEGKFTMPSGGVTVTVEFSKVKYGIKVMEATNGTVSVDKSEAVVGETVTITATPDAEYELASIKVLDKDDKEIEVTEGKFTVPSGGALVTVEFSQIKYDVTVDEIIHGTVSVDKETAVKGETVTVTVTPDAEYELVSITVLDENGEEVENEAGKFTMPSGDVSVVVELSQIKYDVEVKEFANGKALVDKTEAVAGDTVTVVVTPDAEYELVSIKVLDKDNKEVEVTDGKFTMPSGKATVVVELSQIKYAVKVSELENGTVKVDKSEAVKGETVTITATANEGYELTSIKVVDASNNEVTVTDNKFTMPSGDVTVTVSVADIRHTVKLDALANGTVSVDKPEADKGQTVTITVTPDAEYELASVKVVDAENNEVEVTDNKFTMPNSEVTVTVELSQIKYDVKVTQTTNGEVEVDKTNATKGDTVTVTVTPTEGYELSSVTVLDKDNKEVTLTNSTFTMPSGGVTVTVQFTKISYTTDVKPIDPTEEVENVEVGVKESEELNDVLLDSLTETLKEEDNKELATIVGNTSTKVEIEITPVEEETIEEVIVEKMQEKAGDAKIATYFDINVLIKTAKENEVLGNITSLTKEIELMILLPEELRNGDKDISRTYYVIRQHGEYIDKLPATLSEDGKYLVFKSKDFSTYALAYEDTEIKEQPNPDTYDGIGLYVVLGSLSLIGLLSVSIYTKKKQHN